MLQFFGRLHPLVVHFPIALLLAAALFELRPRAARERPDPAGYLCLILGALGALAAAATGWSFAAHDPPGDPELLFRHRWSGVLVAGLAGAVACAALRWSRGSSPGPARATRLGLALLVPLVCFTAHAGGALTYGRGFLLEPLRGDPVEPAEATAAPGGLAADPAPGDAEPDLPAGVSFRVRGVEDHAQVDYLTQIRPLLDEHCAPCHGKNRRPKGKLKLTDMASVLARAPAEAVLVPGDPTQSVLYQRIVLPADDEDRMPPEGEDPLSPEEILLIRDWIAQGAHWAEAASREAE